MSSSTLSVHVRPAIEADIPTLIGFIQDLATYEKEPDQAKATPELMKKNLFEKEYAHALVCEDVNQGNKAIGMALYYFSFSTWTCKPSLFLEDLYVDPSVRNKGAGKALFRALGKVAEEKGCMRMDWQVLNWNEPSIAFYEKVLGSTPMVDWTQQRLELDGIKRLRTLGM
ncbi:hypothetical protein CBS101457_003444 [Exobasidium rhododendri]|nr:hypothetical protein CBS101457_003444 [Exobasidium rhododendri]